MPDGMKGDNWVVQRMFIDPMSEGSIRYDSSVRWNTYTSYSLFSCVRQDINTCPTKADGHGYRTVSNPSEQIPSCGTQILHWYETSKSVTVWAKKNWKYWFDPKLLVGFSYKIWKGAFRAHCTQIWGTSRLAFGGYMLVLHYQAHGEERFPKLFSY